MKFSFQLNETTDVDGNDQLIIFVRYQTKEYFIEQFLFCKPVGWYSYHSTGKNVFTPVDSFLHKHQTYWKNYV